jgi:hypothetical protein
MKGPIDDNATSNKRPSTTAVWNGIREFFQ